MLATGRLGLDRRVLIASLAYAALGAFFILRGHAAGAPGAPQLFTGYVTSATVSRSGRRARPRPAGCAASCACRRRANAVAADAAIYVLWAAGLWPDSLYHAPTRPR